MAATIIGTLSHEFGHYIVAKYYGYDARISYAATYMSETSPDEPKAIAITMGGPVQTMLTGTVGLFLLFLFRNSFQQKDKISVAQWFIIFMALFWLRQTVNFCIWLGSYLINGTFSSGGDEIRIANYFALPVWSLITTMALIGALTLALIIFKFIPQKQRITFLAAGFLGGIVGYLFWVILFGKYIMP